MALLRTLSTKYPLACFSPLLIAYLTGCGSTDDDASPTPNDMTPSPTSSPAPTESPTPGEPGDIALLNQDPPDDDVTVSVSGIITGTTFDGSFWISDEGGGIYSGINVFDTTGQLEAQQLAVGDKVLVDGVFKTFYSVRQIAVYAPSEEGAGGSITLVEKNVGTPSPMKISDITELTPESLCDAQVVDPDLEPYIGTFLELPQLKITAAKGACDTEPGFGIWELQDANGDIILADDDSDYVYSPAVDAEVIVTGVFSFSYNQHKLFPTLIDEIVAPPPPDTWTVYDLNQHPPEDDQVVTVEGRVTAFNDEGNFWIQDPDGGPDSGIYIYDPNQKLAALEGAEGDQVSVTGLFQTYYGLREISVYRDENEGNIIMVEAGAGLLPALELSNLEPLMVSDVCNTENVPAVEPYVGVLLAIDSLTIQAGLGTCETDPNFGLWRVNDADGRDLIMDDEILAYSPTVGSEISITGIVVYSFSRYNMNVKTVTLAPE